MDKNKKYFLKGLYLGLTLMVIHKLLCMFAAEYFYDSSGYYYITGTVFALAVLLFLLSDKVAHFFVTGFTGLFTLLAGEFFLFVTGADFLISHLIFNSKEFGLTWLITYIAGFVGSMLGAAAALGVTLLKIKFNILPKREELSVKKSMKIKLLSYALVSALSFTYLILPENAAISVPVFAVLQFICLLFVVPNRKRLWLFAPIFILSLNSFISGNSIWRVPNFFVSIALYSIMFMDFNIKDITLNFLIRLLENIIEPVRHFGLPFKWALSANKAKAPTIKRILKALAITIPSLIVLMAVLSLADMVFSKAVASFLEELLRYISINVIFKTLFGIAVGLYLFGLVYSAYYKRSGEYIAAKSARQGDLIILNILLISILTVYTVFIVIQFKYLFAGASLPYGLTYTEYARKGFFELLALTGVNVFVILLTVHLTKEVQGRWARMTKWLCCYLCAVTIVLLVSSFYRMWLYSADDGLTRLRFLVFGFLIFEAIGLIFTFAYIIKPRFNIVALYLVIALVYYLCLNIVPIDLIIAKNQIDRYLNQENDGISYILTLSTDAAPQIQRLLTTENIKPDKQEQARLYFENINRYYGSFASRWQRYNLSVNKAQQIYANMHLD